MAIKLIEGFDLVGSSADLASRGWSYAEGSLATTGGRFGGRGYELDADYLTVLTYSSTFTQYNTISFWFKTGEDAKAYIMAIQDANPDGYVFSHTNILIQSASNGVLSLHGDGGILKGSSASGVINVDTWHHIELQANLNVSGSGRVLVDGVEVVSATGDFYEGALNMYVMFTGDDGINTFDDIVIQGDTSSLPSIIGEHKIHTLLPDANTTQADWTGSYTDIDDSFGSSDGDTTYISTTTLNNKSEFDLENLPESPTTIHAVQSVIEARKTDAGTKGVTQYIDSNGTRENGAEFGAAETYGSHTKVHKQNPSGSVAWTESAINALKVGVEITT